MIIDCHTHAPRRREAIISVAPSEFRPEEGHVYSVGIHPWSTDQPADFSILSEAATHPAVVAIGETGIDRLRGADIALQRKIFEFHIDLSEQLRKPLVLHVVKAVDEILAIHKAKKPRMPWIWHGFRGNRQMAKQISDKGIYLSLGERFNPQAAEAIPQRLLLLESDESKLTIQEIAARIAPFRAATAERLLALTGDNLQRAVAYTV